VGLNFSLRGLLEMGDVRTLSRSLLLCALISRYPEALRWAQERLESRWGAAALVSPEFDFQETGFYTATMGERLRKQFVAFQPGVFDPADLANCKLQTNAWEAEYAGLGRHPEVRPLNLDPGYLTEAKLVLATTKDRDHRIYLHSGIYAEVTLHWLRGEWTAERWTYPDYQRPDFQSFFTNCRCFLRGQAIG
jgi:hypothetical protein